MLSGFDYAAVRNHLLKSLTLDISQCYARLVSKNNRSSHEKIHSFSYCLRKHSFRS